MPTFEVPKDYFSLVSISIDSYILKQNYKELISNKNWKPLGILASVVTSGKFRNDGKLWSEMQRLNFKNSIWNIFKRF
jgi:hypothetical protein